MKMKILLAEDEKICQSAVANLGKRLGVEVDLANDGKEAVEKASNKEYNLILMDMFMPEMNGYQATEQIRNGTVNKDTIIIALSGGNFVFNFFNY
jgi:CheY-like chemotaxis protein